MNRGRILSIAKRLSISLLHDKRLLALFFFAPIVAMFIFGFAFSGDVDHVPVTVVNQDRGIELPLIGKVSLSESIIENINQEKLAVTYVSDRSTAEKLVERGDSYAMILFEDSFTENLYRRMSDPEAEGSSRVIIRADQSSINISNTIYQEFVASMLKVMEESGGDLPVNIDVSDPIYGRGTTFMEYFVPGVMSIAVFVLTFLLTILTFVTERTTGTLERLLTTPLRESELVFGSALVFGVIGIFQTALLLLVAVFFFKIHVAGNIFLAFAIVAMLAMVSLSLGIFLSSFAKNAFQAVQFFPLIFLPTFLLSGIFWPVEAIPQWLRPLAYATPPYYAVEACRSIMIKGWGIDRVWREIGALFLFAVIFLAGAILFLQRNRALRDTE